MSRIGKKPIAVPKGVTVQVSEGAVEVKGPKGQLRQPLPPGISVAVDTAHQGYLEPQVAVARSLWAAKCVVKTSRGPRGWAIRA